MLDITVVILTYNEELHIARAIDSVAGICARIVIVDSGSTDRTAEIARERGGDVFENRFETQAQQFQWALENTSIASAWVMRLDADEILTRELCVELTERLGLLPADVVGVNLKRRHIWMGRWVRHGGRYPLVLLRLWRRGHAHVEDRLMDEHIVISGGRAITFHWDFVDHNLNGIGFFISKHNSYATREAIEVICERLGLRVEAARLSRRTSSSQAALKRWVKSRVYARLPFAVGASAYFIWRYFFRFGFLDGRSGLIYHFLQGYWYRFLVGSKAYELELAIAHLESREQMVAEIERITGVRLERARYVRDKA